MQSNCWTRLCRKKSQRIRSFPNWLLPPKTQGGLITNEGRTLVLPHHLGKTMAPPRSTSAAPPVVQRDQPSKFGAQLTPDGVRFRFWAPDCEKVQIDIEGQSGPIAMNNLPRGWHEIEIAGIGAGARYQFVLPNGQHVPDPASRYQPVDVDGPSEIVDPRAFGWTDLGWTSRPWAEAVIYELHVGTFTEAGSFRVLNRGSIICPTSASRQLS